MRRLLKRLGDGKLVAAAAEARWREDGRQRTRLAPISIDPSWWQNAQDIEGADSGLWQTGEFSCLIDDGTGLGDYLRINFYGVRFEFSEMLNTVPRLEEHNPRIPKVGGGYFAAGDPIYDKVELGRRRARDDPPEESSSLLYSDLMRDPEVAKLKEEVAATVGENRDLKARIATLEAELGTVQQPKRNGGAPPKPFWDDLWVAMFRLYYEGAAPSSMAQIAKAMLEWAAANGHELSDSSAKRAARKLWPVVGVQN